VLVKKSKASITIEATLVITMTMMLMITLVGSILSLYIDEQLELAFLNAKNELEVASMPFIGHDKVIRRTVNEGILTEIGTWLYNKELEQFEIDQLIHNLKVEVAFDDLGMGQFKLSYNYTLPTFLGRHEFALPFSPVVYSDGDQRNNKTVFITTYGERFHRSECHYLRKSKFGISIEKARDGGYTPCKVCYPNEPINN
jgi:hypothetical protein